METIEKIFQQSTGETLGLFDIDMVLIQSSIPAFQMPNMVQHKAILKTLLAPLTALEKDMALMLTLKEGHTTLIDNKTPDVIANIHKNTPKLIALTSTLTGPWDDIHDGTLWRVQQLKSVGIDFSSSFPTLMSTIFKNIKPYRNQYPEFKQGILAANGEQKGATLIEFLNYADYQPDNIIFIDDRKHNIEDVEQALLEHHPHIRFTGIHYRGAENLPASLIDAHTFRQTWAKKIAQAQEILSVI